MIADLGAGLKFTDEVEVGHDGALYGLTQDILETFYAINRRTG